MSPCRQPRGQLLPEVRSSGRWEPVLQHWDWGGRQPLLLLLLSGEGLGEPLWDLPPCQQQWVWSWGRGQGPSGSWRLAAESFWCWGRGRKWEWTLNLDYFQWLCWNQPRSLHRKGIWIPLFFLFFLIWWEEKTIFNHNPLWRMIISVLPGITDKGHSCFFSRVVLVQDHRCIVFLKSNQVIS